VDGRGDEGVAGEFRDADVLPCGGVDGPELDYEVTVADGEIVELDVEMQTLIDWNEDLEAFAQLAAFVGTQCGRFDADGHCRSRKQCDQRSKKRTLMETQLVSLAE
jgi:hypothetical protein